MAANFSIMSKRQFAEEAWKRGFAALLNFKKREGHCTVPRFHMEGDYRLGQWVAVQRYTQGNLAKPRKAQLDTIGFVWSERDQWWQEAFAALKAFKAREGHCYVPAHHVEGTIHLGYWVSVQRRWKNKMSRERRQRLNKIGFVWDGTYTKAIKTLRSKRREITSPVAAM